MVDDFLEMNDIHHEKFMRRAIELAKTNPIRPFASLIVDSDGNVLVEAINNVQKSPTFHSEIVAINECAEKYSNLNWESLTLYSTAEPCTMCQAAVYWAGIGSVVFGTKIPLLKTLFGLEIDIRAREVIRKSPKPCNIYSGFLEADCNILFLKASEIRKSTLADCNADIVEDTLI